MMKKPLENKTFKPPLVKAGAKQTAQPSRPMAARPGIKKGK